MVIKKYGLLVLSFLILALGIDAQTWYRPTNSLHELWYNNYDVAARELHNKQHMVDMVVQDESLVGINLSTDLNPDSVKKRKYPFYTHRGQFYYEEGDKYKVFLNPILHFQAGVEGSRQILQNTRGVEFKGNLGGKYGLGFYSRITENQWTAPSFVDSFRRRNDVVPGQIWWKSFKNGGYDFIGARAYITFTPIKNFVTAQFGNDVNFIGFGERSLILSDFAAPYLFLKLNTKFGKRIEYQNIFSKFTDYSPLLGNTLFAPKYGAFHRISAKIGKGTFIGISEIVMYQRADSNQRGYDISYLNPVMFLRAAEVNAGSNDNVMMALDFKQHTNFNTIFYGQFLLDEFNMKFIRQKNGWWANKYGYQLGAKYTSTDAAKSMFSISSEYNRVRPYTYSHFNSGSSYSHFNQSLAHPFGSNFQELYTRVHYVPKKLMGKKNMVIIDASISIAQKGVDSSLLGSNFGGNILRPNTTRKQDFGNALLQGDKINLLLADVTVSYRIGYASFFDVRVQHRAGSSYIAPGTSITMGYRLNTDLSRLNWF
jgi:hypothetical protein